MSGQPTAADRAVYDCVIDWDKDGHTSVGLDAITRHAAQAAAEREAQVIAGVVAYVETYDPQMAQAIEHGDWKGPRHETD